MSNKRPPSPSLGVPPPLEGGSASKKPKTESDAGSPSAAAGAAAPAHAAYMEMPADSSYGGDHGARGYTHQLLKSVWMWLRFTEPTSLLTVENAEDWEVYCMRVQDLDLPVTCLTQEKDHSGSAEQKGVTLTGGEGFEYLKRCLALLRNKKYPKDQLFRYHLCTTAPASSTGSVTLADWAKLQRLQGKYHARAGEAGLHQDQEYIQDQKMFTEKLHRLSQHAGRTASKSIADLEISPDEWAALLRTYYVYCGQQPAGDEDGDVQQQCLELLRRHYRDIPADRVEDAFFVLVTYMLLKQGVSKQNRFFTVRCRDKCINGFRKQKCTLTSEQKSLRERLLDSYQILLDPVASKEQADAIYSFYKSRCAEVIAGDSLSKEMRRELEDIYKKVFDGEQELTEPRKITIDKCYWMSLERQGQGQDADEMDD